MENKLKKKEEELFYKWKKKRPHLVCDGVVNESIWTNQNLKVLFILKEANGGESWDLRRFLNDDGGRWQTWNNIARWQAGFENPNIEWSEISSISKELRRELLRKIAVVNIKKDSGGASAKGADIWTYSWDDREFLKEQILIYKPDVIVCCGTGSVVFERKLINGLDAWKESILGVKYALINNGIKNQIVFDYYHPAIRKKKKTLFDSLINSFREVIEK